jgi:hypothetical protein
VSFVAITHCVASQRVFIVFVYFVIGSVRKLLDTSTHKGISTFIILVQLPPFPWLYSSRRTLTASYILYVRFRGWSF